MNFAVLDLTHKEQWSKYLNLFPASRRDVYFSPEYYALYEAYGDGKAYCFVYQEEDKLLLYPFLRNPITTLGYELEHEYYDIQGAYGYNGPIVNADDSGFVNRFWKVFDQYCEDNDIIAEFMRFHPMIQNRTLGEGHFRMIHDRDTVFLDLSLSKEEIFNGFDKSTKKHILKAMQTIEIRQADNTEENIRIFNRIYRENMEHVHSIPYLLFNLEHFRNMFKLEDIEFFIAYQDDTPIACYSGLVSDHYYSNYLRASLTDYNKTGVNPLMYWSMIQSAKNHGCRFVHFGGGSNPDPENSLLKYKMNFSRTLKEFWIGKRVHNQAIYERITEQWKSMYPESYEKHKVKLLGYREI